MKNLYLFFFAASISLIMFTSCNKCKSCSYAYKFNGKDSTRTFAEECGNKKELKNYEETVNAAAATDNGATVTCTDN